MTGLYFIPAEYSFASQLCDGLFRRFGTTADALAGITLLLPNRRSCLHVRDRLLTLSPHPALLMPDIRPIDDDDDTLQFLPSSSPSMSLEQLPVIPAERRRYLLSSLIRHVAEEEVHDYSLTLEQSLALADSLIHLLDDVQREELAWHYLDQLEPEVYSEHWARTLTYLNILRRRWPAVLGGEGMDEPMRARSRALHALAEHWREHPPEHPVIIAGSTGTQPATRALMRTVSDLSQGYIVLPGLDCRMDSAQWDAVEVSHPQAVLKDLLSAWSTKREEVLPWHDEATDRERQSLVRHLFCAAVESGNWANLALPASAAAGLTVVEVQSQQEEAEAITLMIREQLEQTNASCILVTPDRSLAQRVRYLLSRYNITAYDPASTPVVKTPPGHYMQLLLDAIMPGSDLTHWLALLTHPYTMLGEVSGQASASMRQLEITLRRKRILPVFASFAGWTKWYRRQHEADEDVIACLTQAQQALEPLSRAAMMDERHPFTHWITQLLQAIEYFSQDDDGVVHCWMQPHGMAVWEWCESLRHIMQSSESMSFDAWMLHWQHMMAQALMPPVDDAEKAQVTILTPMEMRLLDADKVILGGMNEGSWPTVVAPDPWMNRRMRDDFGLPPAERLAGQMAHDLAGILSHVPEVILTRACRNAEGPAIASRWWLRLQAVLGTQWQQCDASALWQARVRQLRCAERYTRHEPPEPCPPLEVRPRHLTITEWQILKDDPYRLYARHLLGLQPLQPLRRLPGPSEFGSWVHESCQAYTEHYCEQHTPIHEPEALAWLLAYAKDALAAIEVEDAVAAFWWPRFERLAHWFVTEDRKRRSDDRHILAEIVLDGTLTTDRWQWEIRGRADRVEELVDGRVAVIDYKTGKAPVISHIQQGEALQLLIEAWLLMKGRGDAVAPTDKGTLEYWEMNGKEDAAKQTIVPYDPANLQQVEQWLTELADYFDQSASPYRASPTRVARANQHDYTHLERVREWESRCA